MRRAHHLAVDNQVVMPSRHTQDQDLCRRSQSSMNTGCESSQDNAATARRSLHTQMSVDTSKNQEAYPGRACVCRTGFEVALDDPPLRACPYQVIASGLLYVNPALTKWSPWGCSMLNQPQNDRDKLTDKTTTKIVTCARVTRPLRHSYRRGDSPKTTTMLLPSRQSTVETHSVSQVLRPCYICLAENGLSSTAWKWLMRIIIKKNINVVTFAVKTHK